MRSSDVFSNIDDKTAERLSVGYPVLDSRQKERLYAMSKRKYEIYTGSGSNEVSGVERYRRPKWYKAASIAAAAVLVVAGIGGSTVLISRYGTSPAAGTGIAGTETATLSEEQAASTGASIAEEKNAEAARAEDEQKNIDAVAREMTDEYKTFLCDLWGGNLEVDKSAVVTKTVRTFDDSAEITREFYRITDPGYRTWADLEKRCFEVFDTEFGTSILSACNCTDEANVGYDTVYYTAEDGLFISKDAYESSGGWKGWDQDVITGELALDGSITTTLTKTYTDCNPAFVMETSFRFINTENGWRISKADEEIHTLDN